MQEWTDEEVYQQLASLTTQCEGHVVLTLADIEAVLFDPRFPQAKEALARSLLERLVRPPIEKAT